MGLKYLLIILILSPLHLYSQEVKVRKTEKINIPKDGTWALSAAAPDGRSLLITGENMRGLHLLNLKKGTLTTISDAPGSGYEPVFTTDGKKIYYRSDEYRNNRKYTSLEEYEVLSARKRQVEAPSRVLVSPALSGTSLNYMIEGKRRHIDSGTGESIKGAEGVYLLLEDLVPVLYVNGTRKELRPNGAGNYIWASLSPDQSKIMYNFGGTLTCIADTSGIILRELGRLNAPEWISNNLIVAMNDVDDGHRVISSDICCYSLVSNKLYNLTRSDDIIEMYPLPLSNRNIIACQTSEGELFLIHYSIRKHVK